jgi:hypothetical protein
MQNAGFWTLGKAKSKGPITVREPQIGTCRVTVIKTLCQPNTTAAETIVARKTSIENQ